MSQCLLQRDRSCRARQALELGKCVLGTDEEEQEVGTAKSRHEPPQSHKSVADAYMHRQRFESDGVLTARNLVKNSLYFTILALQSR